MHTALVRVLSGYLRIATGSVRELGGRLLHRPGLRSAGTVQRVAGEVQILCARADVLLQSQVRPPRAAVRSSGGTAHGLPARRVAAGLRLTG